MLKLIQSGNSKLHNQYMFNIEVSTEICGRAICKGCYAFKEQLRYPSVVKARNSRYLASQEVDFSQRIIKEIQSIKKPFKAFRIHSAGEFYSQEYINKWTAIAQALPNSSFYAFTKRLPDFDFSQLVALPNVAIINSLHTGKLNYDKLANLDPALPICPATTIKAGCGTDCTFCFYKGQADVSSIQFVRH